MNVFFNYIMLISLLIVPLIGSILLITTTFKVFLMFNLGFLFSGILSYLGIYLAISNIIINIFYKFSNLNPKLVTKFCIFFLFTFILYYIYIRYNTIFLDTQVKITYKGVALEVKGPLLEKIAENDEFLAFSVGAVIGAFAVSKNLLPRVGGAALGGGTSQLTYVVAKETGERFKGLLNVRRTEESKVEIEVGDIVPDTSSSTTLPSMPNSGNVNTSIFSEIRNQVRQSGIEESFIQRVTVNANPQPTTKPNTILELVQNVDVSSKFKDPSTMFQNCSIQEYGTMVKDLIIPSPYEEEIKLYISNVLYLLELDLTLSLMMIGLVLFIIYVFTIRLFFEKHFNSKFNFNFISKLPFGDTLQIILNKVSTFSKYSNNIWFYFMYICLLLATLSSTYCIYTCVQILKMIPS